MNRDRGQTTLDFAIGVSVFLLAVAFVFSFIPGMVQPFADSGQEDMTVSNRLADRLATDVLTSGEPYILDKSCTMSFFEEDAPADVPNYCAFEGGGVEDVLALDLRTNVHVSLTGDLNDDGTEESYTAGDSIPASGSTTTATRRVTVDGTPTKLVVKVW
ncbi:DUF7287 family protein [Halomarina rubra]|uniref:Uncharacterized protein n=1 Tax=Halomarina rubra TaxID=2071873 RepID=A0ABD6ATG0_9EURY|nr:hypothetical protein [Halomarina rubra]